MDPTEANLTIYDPACYRIRARGALDARWSRWMHEMQLVVEAGADVPTLTLRGTLCDQAALMGVLNQLAQLGLPLISVEVATADGGACGGHVVEPAAGARPTLAITVDK